jgi:hypothetical protein
VTRDGPLASLTPARNNPFCFSLVVPAAGAFARSCATDLTYIKVIRPDPAGMFDAAIPVPHRRRQCLSVPTNRSPSAIYSTDLA